MKKNSDQVADREDSGNYNINFNRVLKKTFLNASESRNSPQKLGNEVDLSMTSPIKN